MYEEFGFEIDFTQKMGFMILRFAPTFWARALVWENSTELFSLRFQTRSNNLCTKFSFEFKRFSFHNLLNHLLNTTKELSTASGFYFFLTTTHLPYCYEYASAPTKYITRS
jgi:hypothetical protein